MSEGGTNLHNTDFISDLKAIVKKLVLGCSGLSITGIAANLWVVLLVSQGLQLVCGWCSQYHWDYGQSVGGALSVTESTASLWVLL